MTADNHNLRAEIFAAAIRQGPSFIVLLLILFGMWRVGEFLVTEGIGRAIGEIQQGYREIQQAHDADLKQVIGAFERERERESAMVNLIREVVENRDLLEQSHQILVDMVSEKREAQEERSTP